MNEREGNLACDANSDLIEFQANTRSSTIVDNRNPVAMTSKHINEKFFGDSSKVDSLNQRHAHEDNSVNVLSIPSTLSKFKNIRCACSNSENDSDCVHQGKIARR